MTTKDINRLRLVNQKISGGKFKSPAEVVRWMGAMQAQDYPGALWGVGLRTEESTLAAVEQAIVDREIVRTWPMRGTLHFVPAENVRWMLSLLTPRIVRSAASRHRNLGLDEDIFAKSRTLFEKELQGGKILTRSEMYEMLEQAGISAVGQRGIHILWKLSQEGLLCFGPYKGKQPTFVLLDEWIPGSRPGTFSYMNVPRNDSVLFLHGFMF